MQSLVFISDDQLASGGSDNLVRIWSLVSGSVLYQLAGHTGSVVALAYDSQAAMLVTGSYDTTMRIWDLRQLDQQPTARRSPLSR